MGALFGWLGTLVLNVAGLFAARISQKAALAAAAIAVSVALTTAMAIALKALIVGIEVSAPDWVTAGAIFLPSNLATCMSAIIAAHVARWAYDWNMTNLKLASAINLGGVSARERLCDHR